MTERDETILVTGATGRQGGAVTRALLSGDWSVRALTRDPEQPAARALSEAGADVVRGDLEERASVNRALEGCYGCFSVQQFWEHGVEGEVRQGRTLADAALAAGVEHFVYSSVASADADTGIPHFESKAEVERHVRGSGLAFTVLRPVFFMENFEGEGYRRQILDGALEMPLPPDTPLQTVAVSDIGAFAARAFSRPDRHLGRTLELAGDERAVAEIADAFGRFLGREVTYEVQPIQEVRAFSEDMATMFEWFRDVGYEVDLEPLREVHPGLLTLEDWLPTSSFAGQGGSA